MVSLSSTKDKDLKSFSFKEHKLLLMQYFLAFGNSRTFPGSPRVFCLPSALCLGGVPPMSSTSNAIPLSTVFLTGSDRIPIYGMASLQIVIQSTASGEEYLPVAHTCYNLLDLPKYSSKETMRARLTQALDNYEGFSLAWGSPVCPRFLSLPPCPHEDYTENRREGVLFLYCTSGVGLLNSEPDYCVFLGL